MVKRGGTGTELRVETEMIRADAMTLGVGIRFFVFALYDGLWNCLNSGLVQAAQSSNSKSCTRSEWLLRGMGLQHCDFPSNVGYGPDCLLDTACSKTTYAT